MRTHVKLSNILLRKQHPLDGTHLVAVRGLIQEVVPTSASTSGARRSNAATSDKDKQIYLSTLPRTGFDAEVCSYLAFHS